MDELQEFINQSIGIVDNDEERDDNGNIIKFRRKDYAEISQFDEFNNLIHYKNTEGIEF